MTKERIVRAHNGNIQDLDLSTRDGMGYTHHWEVVRVLETIEKDYGWCDYLVLLREKREACQTAT